MSRILVTGGAGFIGSHLVHALAKADHEVTVLDDLSGGFLRNLKLDSDPERSGIEFVCGSVCDAELVEQLFERRKFDFVYHLAAYAAEGLSHFIRRFNYENNVGGSVNVVNACARHNVKKLVFTSSIAVYGHATPPFSENQTPTPADPYAIAKYAVELDLAAAHEMFGLNYTIFRPHNVYGEHQHIGDRYRNVVGIFMNQMLRGEPLTIFGDGEQTRAFSYVSDVINPMVACISEPKSDLGVFNVGGVGTYSVNELSRYVTKAAGQSDRPVMHLPARKEVVHAYSNHTHLRQVFGGDATSVSLQEGVERMWRWAKELGAQAPLPTPVVEVAKNLPPSWR